MTANSHLKPYHYVNTIVVLGGIVSWMITEDMYEDVMRILNILKACT